MFAEQANNKQNSFQLPTGAGKRDKCACICLYNYLFRLKIFYLPASLRTKKTLFYLANIFSNENSGKCTPKYEYVSGSLINSTRNHRK
jgi:hypothetical protein